MKMKKNITNLLWIIVLTTIALSACGSQNPEELLGEKIWELTSMGPENNPIPILLNSKVTLQFNFDETQISGKASCNNYFAGFEIDEDEIKISAAGSTMMYCEPEELMAQENAFLMALGEAHHFTIQNGELTIQFGNNQVLLFK